MTPNELHYDPALLVFDFLWGFLENKKKKESMPSNLPTVKIWKSFSIKLLSTLLYPGHFVKTGGNSTQNLVWMWRQMMTHIHQQGMKRFMTYITELSRTSRAVTSKSKIAREKKESRLSWGFYCGQGAGLGEDSQQKAGIGQFESPTRAKGGTPGLPYPSAQVRGTGRGSVRLKSYLQSSIKIEFNPLLQTSSTQ